MDNVKLLIKDYLYLKQEIYISCLNKCLNLNLNDLNNKEKLCLNDCVKKINNLLINN